MARLLEKFSEFAATATVDKFPEVARTRAVDAIVDCIGCIVAGTDEPTAALLRSVTTFRNSPDGFVSYVRGGGYTSPAEAALCHGAAAHALDYDDTNHPAYAHPSAVLVPSLLALAPHTDASGADFVASYIVGFEMFGKLGRALNKAHYIKGWHTTYSFGVLASAITSARFLGLPADRTEVALAIAASGAAGLRANFGTMVKPLHAGLAAQTGVRAALLARAGYGASVDIFEHEFGYFSVLRGDGASNPDAMRDPGEALELLYEYGLALKPYPCCGATHPSIEAAIEIHKWMGGSAGLQDVRSVRVGSSRMAFVPLIYKNPTTPLQGKFSLEFCVAAGVVEGRVNLGTFTDEKISDPVIQSIQRKLLVEVDDRVAESSEFGAAISVTMADQRTHEVLVPFAKGKPDRWMSRSDIGAKLADCFRFAGADGAEEAHILLARTEETRSASELIRALQ